MGSIVIHERTTEHGALERTTLHADDGALSLVTGPHRAPLPEGALEAVLGRFGRPMAFAESDVKVEASLELGQGRRLIRFRFRPRYDVIARDYVALCTPGQDPLCDLAVAVTGALDHLARAWARTSSASQ